MWFFIWLFFFLDRSQNSCTSFQKGTPPLEGDIHSEYLKQGRIFLSWNDVKKVIFSNPWLQKDTLGRDIIRWVISLSLFWYCYNILEIIFCLSIFQLYLGFSCHTNDFLIIGMFYTKVIDCSIMCKSKKLLALQLSDHWKGFL